jgi:hypothetical protein
MFVSKMGKPEDYIRKPFNNEKGDQIGEIIDCKEVDDKYLLTMDAELDIMASDNLKTMSFLFKEVKYNVE